MTGRGWVGGRGWVVERVSSYLCLCWCGQQCGYIAGVGTAVRAHGWCWCGHSSVGTQLVLVWAAVRVHGWCWAQQCKHMAGGGVGSTEGSHAAVCCHMHENVLLCVRGECAPWNAAETHGGRLCARLAAQVQVPSDSALGEAVDVVTPGKNQGLTVPRRFCGGRWGSASPSGPSLGNCFSLDPAHSVGPRAGLGVGVGHRGGPVPAPLSLSLPR